MESEILGKLEEQGRKIEEIHASVERMRRYFLWTLIIGLAVIVLPLIGLLFAVPQFLNVYNPSNLGL